MKSLPQNNLYVFLLLLLAGFAIYANVIPGKFIFDDNLFIENNEQIKSLSNIPELYRSSVTEGSSVGADNFYRPNQQALYAFLYAAFGMNPIPFHVASLLFHIINSFLIFLLFLKLGTGRNASFFSALIFLIHPINTQAVSYISGLADPMGLMFVLSALLSFITFLKSQKLPFAAASVFVFALGLFTKENTVVFPALALITFNFLYNSVKHPSAPGKGLEVRIILILYFLIAGTYIYFKFTSLNFAGNLGLTDQKNIYTENLHIRLITFLNILPEYFKMAFFPIRLNYEKPYTAYVDFQRTEGVAGLLIFIAFLGIALYTFWKRFRFGHGLNSGKRPLANFNSHEGFVFGGLWFFICLAPVSGIIPVNAIFLEHWLYYPVIGLIFGFAKIYESQKGFVQKIFLFSIIPLCLGYCVRSVLRNAEWANGIKFYKNEIRHAPNSARMHNNIAMIYADEGKCPLAINHYKKAIALYDIYPQTHHNMARCLETLGQLNEAVNEYFKALLLYPDFAYSHQQLLNVFRNTGNNSQAMIFEAFLSRIRNGESIQREEIVQAINKISK